MISPTRVKLPKYSYIFSNIRSLTTVPKNDDRSFNNISIPKFYEGKSVFMTGGTGFLGKLIVEKLLYSCPDIGNIYLLTRAESEEHAQQRIKELVDGSMSLFTRVKREVPKNISKIIPIVGELGKPILGIRPEDVEKLIDEVSVVIHLAATIKFNDTLRIAMSYNVDGTKEVLGLSKRMKKIESFVHVSTMYCNVTKNRTEVEEYVYPVLKAVENLRGLLDKYGDLKTPPSHVLHGFQNTYTLSKALAENVILDEHGDVPTAIVRPSMVGCCLNEPIKGWMDNISNHTYYVYFAAKGLLRIMHGDERNFIDFIPADYPVNTIIVAAARCVGKDVKVYNSATSSCNPITFEKLFGLFIEESVKNKLNDLPYPRVIFVKSKLLLKLLTFFTHIVPAYIIDILSKIKGKPTGLVHVQRSLLNRRDKNEFFTSNNWVMKADECRKLDTTLDARDKKIFPCDPSKFSWKEYISIYMDGIRKCLTDMNNKK